MKKLLRLQKYVETELRENPSSRKSDTELLLGVFKRLGIDTSESFESLAHNGQLKQMESITRARRKIQEKFPELKDIETTVFREERQEVFKNYARTV